MRLSFKDRIAFHYMLATALIMASAFSAVFFTVKSTVFRNLDKVLSYEAEKHVREIQIIGDSLRFSNKEEWEEQEHKEVQINPVFIQLIDKDGVLMDKSPNLKEDQLPFEEARFGGHFNTIISNRALRQAQLPIEENGKIRGYILAAMSSESSLSVIQKLSNVLWVSYFIVLIGLYFISRFLAGRSIIPIRNITETIANITKNNLKERVELPQNKDELYDLSYSFNALLNRIEEALDREKQFTSDASHELRTPLASLRGTLEVLIRKPRPPEVYEEKVKYCLQEIDRMTSMVEQLLQLARFEATHQNNQDGLKSLSSIFEETITHFQNQLFSKNLQINLDLGDGHKVFVPAFNSSIIIDNIMSNAIKYAHEGTAIGISGDIIESRFVCTVKDSGIGIKESDLNRIYDSFFRSDALNHKSISGNGLGLAIAKKCADAIQAELSISSTIGEGTTVSISFLLNNTA
jgi:signal transduction histidine kinase